MKIKKFLLIILFMFFLVLVGCAKNDKDSEAPMEPSIPGDYTGAPIDSESKSESEGDVISGTDGIVTEGGKDEGGFNNTQAGQMSAKEWSDINNYSFWTELFMSSQDSKDGLFKEYFNKGYFDTLNMVTVTVKNQDVLIQGAKVELVDGNGKTIYTSITNTVGNAFLFPQKEQLEAIKEIYITVNGQTNKYEYSYSTENNKLSYDISLSNEKEKIIELMFVVDTTGSMGDEINYLKAEIDYVISEIKNSYNDVQIKLALLFYRDLTDSYVTKYFDFTTDINVQKKNLSEQYAGGGGDFEEAVDIALDEAVSKNWSNENTTKLLFHVLDAPPHYTQEIMTRYFNAINKASSIGIRIIPVASSGIDKYTEYLLRNEAMMTGGTYTFITNDSGIGGDHIEGTIGEADVEYLDLMIIRLIKEYYTGIPQEKVIYKK